MSAAGHTMIGRSDTKVAVGLGVIADVDDDGDVYPRLAKAGDIPYAVTAGSEWRPALDTYDFSASQGGNVTIDDVADIGISTRHPRPSEPVYYSLSKARMSVDKGSDGILCGHLSRVSRLHGRTRGGLALNRHFVVPRQASATDVWYPLPQAGEAGDVAVAVNPKGSLARVEVTQPLADPARPGVKPAVLHTIAADATKETDTVFRKTETGWELVTGHFALWRAAMNFSILAIHGQLHERVPRITFGGSRHIAKTTSLRTSRKGFVWTVNTRSPVKGVTADGEKLVMPDVSNRSLGVRLETKKLDGTIVSRGDLMLGMQSGTRLALHESSNYAILVEAKRATDSKVKLELDEPPGVLAGDIGHDVDLYVYELRAVATY